MNTEAKANTAAKDGQGITRAAIEAAEIVKRAANLAAAAVEYDPFGAVVYEAHGVWQSAIAAFVAIGDSRGVDWAVAHSLEGRSPSKAKRTARGIRAYAAALLKMAKGSTLFGSRRPSLANARAGVFNGLEAVLQMV